MSTPRLSLICIVATILLTACATTDVPPKVTGYQATQSWPLENAVSALDMAPVGDFVLLTYKGASGDNALEIHRFNLPAGVKKTFRLQRGADGLMIRANGEAVAIAIAQDGATFLANWPGYLVSATTDSGVMQAVVAIPSGGFGEVRFNRLEFAPDRTAAFGVGEEVVRFDMTGQGITFSRDIEAPGGTSLAVIDSMKIATGNTQQVTTVASAGADAPDCVIKEGVALDLDTSPDRSRLAGAMYDVVAKRTDIVIWNITDCREMTRWTTDGSSLFDIAWLPDGDRIATAGGDGQLRFWDIASGAEVDRLAVEQDGGFRMYFSNDATRLVTFTLWGDRTLRLFQRH